MRLKEVFFVTGSAIQWFKKDGLEIIKMLVENRKIAVNSTSADEPFL